MSRSILVFKSPTLEKKYIFREDSHIDFVHEKRHMDGVSLETPPLPPPLETSHI
jgi:hypothetical protein